MVGPTCVSNRWLISKNVELPGASPMTRKHSGGGMWKT